MEIIISTVTFVLFRVFDSGVGLSIFDRLRFYFTKMSDEEIDDTNSEQPLSDAPHYVYVRIGMLCNSKILPNTMFRAPRASGASAPRPTLGAALQAGAGAALQAVAGAALAGGSAPRAGAGAARWAAARKLLRAVVDAELWVAAGAALLAATGASG